MQQLFFTLYTHKAAPIFSDPKQVQLLRQAFGVVMQREPFQVDAAIILPDHLHMIWTLPTGDKQADLRWRQIKGWFTKRYNAQEEDNHALPAFSRAFKSQVIRDRLDFELYLHYIHVDAVKHGWVEHAADWTYSSYRKWLDLGFYQQQLEQDDNDDRPTDEYPDTDRHSDILV